MKKLMLSTFVALLSVSAFAQNSAADNNDVKTPAAKVTETKAECTVTIEANDMMQYNKKEFTVNKEQCAEFTVNLDHVGKSPANVGGHNVVISKTADIGGIAKDGAVAKIENNYVKPDDARVIAHTKLIGGGQNASVTFKTAALDKDGDYSFFCSYPGHYTMMHGKVIVK